MNVRKLILLAVFAILIASYFFFDLGQYLSLEYIKNQQASFDALYQENPALILGGFFIMYVVVTALSLPGAAIMTLAAGALFGSGWPCCCVRHPSVPLAFLASRFRSMMLQQRFGDRLKAQRRCQKTGPLSLLCVWFRLFRSLSCLVWVSPLSRCALTGSARWACWPAPLSMCWRARNWGK